MPPAQSADRTLWKAIKSGVYDRVYYFFGQEDYLKEQMLRELIAAATDPATRDFNLDVRDAAGLDAESLGSLLSTPPMMAERRMLVLREPANLKKDPRKVLDTYLSKPAPDLLLVIISAGGEKAKVDKAIQQHSKALDFAPLDSKRLTAWMDHHASSKLGVSITPGAAELLASATGSDLALLVAELDKLTSYTGGSEIGEDAVTEVVGIRRGETVSDLLDAIGDRNTVRALSLLPHVLQQPKVSAVPLVMNLTVQTLALGWGVALRADGRHVDFAGYMRSVPGLFTGRPWGETAGAWQKMLSRWDAASVNAGLEALLEADMTLKDTRISSDEAILRTLILRLCTSSSAKSHPAARSIVAA